MKHQTIDKAGEGRGERMDRGGGGGEKEERRGEERGRQRNIMPHTWNEDILAYEGAIV